MQIAKWFFATLSCGVFVFSARAHEHIEPALTRQAAEQNAILIPERADYPAYFREAYIAYPRIPHGTLEAIAYVQSRWQHLMPSGTSHQHMPQAYGVMGLYDGGGFAGQVGSAAKLLSIPAERIKSDPRVNILAGAALLDRELATRAVNAVEDIAPVLAAYAGYTAAHGRVQTFARTTFAYDVLSTLDRGVDREGVHVPKRILRWERIFDPQTRAMLRAPSVRVDVTHDRIDRVVEKNQVSAASTPVTTLLSTDYAPALWVASPYYSGRSSYDAVTIHTTQGSYGGTISWFQNNPYEVSAHYVIRSSDGQITQMVRESNAAHHVGVHNQTTLGIEHEGYIDNPAWYTSALYNASAGLTRHFCSRYAIPCSSAYSGPAHNGVVVLSTSIKIKGHQHFSQQTHTDPGINWNWGHYYTLLNGGTPPPPPPSGVVKYWVDTSPNAPSFGSSTSTAQTGTLYAGTNYVYCKTWGREIRNGSSFNHWWLKTDPDVGPANQWVSAYYSSRWGNDEARDNDGYDLPRCEVLPYGAIADKYYALGGVRSVLGVPKYAEAAAQLNGRFQEFANGIILWHRDTGAYAIRGAFLSYFWANGSEGRWGFAMMDEANAARSPATGQVGRYQYFQRGLFLWTPATGAHVLHGAILDYFEDNGREAKFGYPTSDEQTYGTSGRKQTFEKATFYWTAERGVWVN